ncbi:MAG: PrgI family protein [Candidatus Kaiserbacteria bacterium]|nr:PrgI family protein [Candidatus Kaiserbacteria bacterium]
MEYQVPQFIEVENKIVGPLTLRQFIYIAGAAGLCILFFFYLKTVFAVLFSLPVVAFAAALAFYKVNGKPFVEVLEAGFNYYTGAKLFLWKHKEPKTEEKNSARDAAEAAETALRASHGTTKLTRGKLSKIAWSLYVSSGNVPSDEQKII